jgi:hypothetical protein
MFDEFDDGRDWEAEMEASEKRLERECQLRASLQRALDAGFERRAEAARQLLEVLEEND